MATISAAASEGVVSTRAKHTPGPWRTGSENVHGLLILAPKPEHPTGEMSVACVNVYHSIGRPRAEGEATARLIAAAPELDAALDQAWKALAWIKNYDSEDGVIADALKQIEAARERAGTYDYAAMRARVEAIRSQIVGVSRTEDALRSGQRE